MNLSDIVNGPWAITPEMLLEIQSIYSVHLRGESIDLAAVAAKIGRPLNNNRTITSRQQGVTVIDIQGPIAKKMNLLTDISGGCSSQLVMAAFNQALDDTDVKGIILNIDSPGGTVDGTGELADLIYQSRGKKPIICFSDGMIASAAYWIASACDKIFISGDTNPVGSIGVVAAHRDYSGLETQRGVKTTEISAGKYKRVSSQYEPLSADGRSEIQSKVDYLYTVFVDAVARYRRVSTKRVLSDMADGRIFIGKQAIKAGLADGVSTLPAIVESMQKRPAKAAAATRPVQAMSDATVAALIAFQQQPAPEPAAPTVDIAAERRKIAANIARGALTPDVTR